ncbi:hypothetical protein E3T28_14825 [Cryobacterium sinapicolor]|uniref:IPT/TIG domain-containing protein n=1 Tax=Cryobacterium sinapicolor TaxID=1259236 RepID=A0ABY2IUU9_9MICO|nr:IPT/TIG domain-containing protein [Cryobacterium sinapicolor]TFC94573.1 hypothetical protein E3T28_14825 [Cryobacterium sinapicolor]
MAQIAVNPLVLKDVVISFGTDSYEAAVSNVTFTPSASTITWKGLTPAAVYSAATAATWAADLTYVQDWETVNSLSRFLFDNEGAEVAATFKPRSGSGPSFTAILIVTPGAIGGAVDSFGETSVSLGSKGKPALVAAVATVPTVTLAAPATGGIAGGTLVKVTGSRFTGATVVKFGTITATSFTVETDGILYVVAPAAAAGSKPVTVTNAVGVSATSAAYTYA